MNSGELVDLLLAAKKAYYNSSEPLMSDEEYDRLEEELRQQDPENAFFSIVGSEDTGGSARVRHEIPMLSMGKVKTMEGFVKWYEKISDSDPVICMKPKIDGLSAGCRYANGRLSLIATRGDGRTGQDISHIKQWMKDFPESLPKALNCEIRGELYLPKDTAFDTGGRPLRNNCVGLINRKENREDLEYVRFISYQIVSPAPLDFSSEAAKIDFLRDAGFHTVPYQLCTGTEEVSEYYASYLESLRENWLFETDGLIATVNDISLHDEIDSKWVVDHHHHYDIAIKPPADMKNSVLIDVEWNVSRQGNLIPVAIFAPVVIGGATLQRASLHNAQFVRDLKLHKGDKLEIERANDVIPYIRQNLSRDESAISDLLPSSCPACDSRLEDAGVHIRCTNSSCEEKNIQQILYWVRESGMEQIAEQTVRSLYRFGIVTKIKDLYSLDENKLESLEGFGDKKISKLLSTVASTRTLSTADFISKLGIPLVQKKSLRKLNISSIRDFIDFSDDTYVIGKNIIEWKSDRANMELFDELREVLSVNSETAVADNGRKVCLTGSGPAGRKELAALLEKKGFVFSNSVGKETDILVCENPDAGSSKLQKARKLGLEIVSYHDFFPDLF